MIKLLNIIEIGGAPDFSKLFKQLNIEAISVNSMRKGLKQLKKVTPDIIVAEYNFQSDFRDRSSNLESLMAVLQRHPSIQLIVFYEKQHQLIFNQFCARFSNIHPIVYPVKAAQMLLTLETIIANK